jgi:hypothetical protein
MTDQDFAPITWAYDETTAEVVKAKGRLYGNLATFIWLLAVITLAVAAPLVVLVWRAAF